MAVEYDVNSVPAGGSNALQQGLPDVEEEEEENEEKAEEAAGCSTG